MKKFNINVNDIELLKALSKQIDGTSMTILVNRELVYFVYQSAELYFHKAYVIAERTGFSHDDFLILRVDKTDFLSLAIDGIMMFTVEDNKLTIDFALTSGEVEYSLTVGFQEDLVDRYWDYLSLFKDTENYPAINLAPFGTMIKMGKLHSKMVISDGQFISLDYGNKLFIYKEYPTEVFGANTKLLGLMYSVGGVCHSVKNYLVYRGDDVCIAIKKTRVNSIYGNDEGCVNNYVKKGKPQFKALLNVSNLTKLLRKLRFNEGDVYIDLEDENIVATSNGKVFKTTVTVEKIKDYNAPNVKELDLESLSFDLNQTSAMSEDVGRTFPKIKVPVEVVRNILTQLTKTDKLLVTVKRNYIIFDMLKMRIVFGRETETTKP